MRSELCRKMAVVNGVNSIKKSMPGKKTIRIKDKKRRCGMDSRSWNE